MTDFARELYVNLPVSDVPATKRFFASLGFAFEPRFTNDDAACMILGDHAYVMLLTRRFFATFTPRALGDPETSTLGLFAYNVSSRAEVDRAVELAVRAGGREARAAMDHGFMYSRSFFDLDGHQWEVLHIDQAQLPGAAA
ncbi:MAG: hypothetical protein KC731_11980 [Myxococcales bacterium]|nr:hypothetical protein [Myxococcales bacterium]